MAFGEEITIIKSNWNKYELEYLNESVDIIGRADVCALVMEEGVGHFCYISQNTTFIKYKVEKNI